MELVRIIWSHSGRHIMTRTHESSLATSVTLSDPGTVKRLAVTGRGIVDSEGTDLIYALMHYVEHPQECPPQRKPRDHPIS